MDCGSLHGAATRRRLRPQAACAPGRLSTGSHRPRRRRNGGRRPGPLGGRRGDPAGLSRRHLLWQLSAGRPDFARHLPDITLRGCGVVKGEWPSRCLPGASCTGWSGSGQQLCGGLSTDKGFANDRT
jgi:hypothetical protein